MLRRVAVVAGMLAALLGGAGQTQAASVLLATIPPPSPGAPAVNQVLTDLNAGPGQDLITGVSLIAKFEVSGTTLVPETGVAGNFQFTTPTSGEIRSGSFAYTGGDKILYYTLKAGTGSQLFGFFDASGNQIALQAGEVVSFMTSKGLSNAAFFGTRQPIPEPASMLLFVAGGALVAFSARRSRRSSSV